VADEFRRIDPLALKVKPGLVQQGPTGDKPVLRWIGIDCLRIDPAYQRNIMYRGRENIIRIAREFDWAMFTPVVVSELTDRGLFLIIDGQHRTTSAALRRIRDVPCSIVNIGSQAQAAAFAAINGRVTAISSQQLHTARVAAGDAKALELAEVCAQASVTICTYPVPANKMKRGETLAVAALARALRLYGRDVLVLALACLVQTGDGNIGLIRKALINALCAVLSLEPEWQDEKLLLPVMRSMDFAANWEAAGKASFDERCSLESKLVDLIAEHIETSLARRRA
jgi:hypothetical protein